MTEPGDYLTADAIRRDRMIYGKGWCKRENPKELAPGVIVMLCANNSRRGEVHVTVCIDPEALIRNNAGDNT